MIRLSTPNHQRLEQSTELDLSVGGAELNVAAGVSRLGLRSAWVSRLPMNPLGRLVKNKGHEFGVDMDHILWTEGERVGIYFVEHGISPRPTQVFYDRGSSSMTRVQPGMIDWETLLKRSRLFHVSGITPAISSSAASVVKEALQMARSVGCLVSYDLNYRAQLWSIEEARTAQVPFMDYVDILVTSIPDEPGVNELISGLSGEKPAQVAQKLAEYFGFRVVLVTKRGTSSLNQSTWTSLAYYDNQAYTDRTYTIQSVDRLGGGDACVAGFLTGYLEGDISYAVHLGNAFSVLTQTSPTDWPWPSREEAEELITIGESQIRR